MQLSMAAAGGGSTTAGSEEFTDNLHKLENRLAAAVAPVIDLLTVPNSETPLILSETEVKRTLHQNSHCGGPAAPVFAGYLSEPSSLLLQWIPNPKETLVGGPPIRAFQVMMDSGTAIQSATSSSSGVTSSGGVGLKDSKSAPPPPPAVATVTYATLIDPARAERRGQFREVYQGSDTRCHVTGLSSNTAYMVKVRAKSDAGWGSWNEAKLVATLPAPHEVYLMGGLESEGKSLQTCERYDTLTGQWSAFSTGAANAQQMSTKRANCSTVALNGKLCLVGGDDGLFPLNSVECYDPFTAKWISLQPMFTKRSGCASVVVYSKLYALGGCDSAQNVFYNSCEGIHRPSFHCRCQSVI